jgi:hypothetical protein
VTFAEATLSYENWLAAALPAPVVPTDLVEKHRVLADPADPFPFFRGTYYRWCQHWTSGPVSDAPKVLAVGDLHLANFGTWRDADGRLCWGVNDFDEADDLPYTNDLVRLAASIRFARKAGTLDIKFAEGCQAILEGYQECLEHPGGQPFVLEEHHPHLRDIATAADRDPTAFWAKMTKLLGGPAAAIPEDAREVLEKAMPAAAIAVEYRARRAGVGSLGRPRYVALADWRGGKICREAKAAAPPATAWVSEAPTACRASEAADRSVRSPDPFYRLSGRWIVRRLGPRSSRIELLELKSVDLHRVLHAMGAETANIHLGTRPASDAIRADLRKRSVGWLADAAKTLADRLETDWQAWRSSGPVPGGGEHHAAGK